jgi:ribosome-associated toxin RatA of RatAB toxin-antitoxin module
VRAVALLAALLALAAPAPAAAKNRALSSRAADLHIPTLATLTQRGDVALIETTPEGRCRQVVLFALLEAPPEKVWDVLMDVEAYPKYLKTVVSVEITGKKAGVTAFEWELDVPFFNLKGTRLQRGVRPTLVEVRGQSGNLRGTRERWELYPVEGGRTLAAFYRALDVETGGLLLNTMVKLEPSMDQGAALSTGFVHIRELAAHVAGRPALDPNPKPRTGPVPAFRSLELGKGELSFAPLEGLLKHGQLALIESHPDGVLKQVALFTRVAAPPEKMKQIVQDPAKYPEFIPNFARQDVERTEDGKLRMDWELDVPLSSVAGVSLMTIEADGTVDVVAQSGDIKRGRWRWEFRDGGPGATIPIHYVYSDVREASWVTKKLVEKQPLLEHGIVIASGTVAMTAMKARAEGVR